MSMILAYLGLQMLDCADYLLSLSPRRRMPGPKQTSGSLLLWQDPLLNNRAQVYVLAIWFRWRRAGDNGDRRDGTGDVDQAALKVGRVCLMGLNSWVRCGEE
jgi:hypothetical protein